LESRTPQPVRDALSLARCRQRTATHVTKTLEETDTNMLTGDAGSQTKASWAASRPVDHCFIKADERGAAILLIDRTTSSTPLELA
jgi:hypothetical protein